MEEEEEGGLYRKEGKRSEGSGIPRGRQDPTFSCIEQREEREGEEEEEEGSKKRDSAKTKIWAKKRGRSKGKGREGKVLFKLLQRALFL